MKVSGLTTEFVTFVALNVIYIRVNSRQRNHCIIKILYACIRVNNRRCYYCSIGYSKWISGSTKTLRVNNLEQNIYSEFQGQAYSVNCIFVYIFRQAIQDILTPKTSRMLVLVFQTASITRLGYKSNDFKLTQ